MSAQDVLLWGFPTLVCCEAGVGEGAGPLCPCTLFTLHCLGHFPLVPLAAWDTLSSQWVLISFLRKMCFESSQLSFSDSCVLETI